MNKSDSEQQHPQYKKDRAIVDNLLTVSLSPSDSNLADLARLMIRYQGFPGARDIQKDLQSLLTQWGFTQESLYQKTREIHRIGQVYKRKNSEEEDWI